MAGRIEWNVLPMILDPATATDGGRTSVLLADDDDRFRAILRSVLEDAGYDVVAEAHDASSTLAQAAERTTDVVVLDVVMPGSRGLDTAKALLAQDPVRPILLISSLFDPLLEREAVAHGMWYLEKVEGLEALEHAIAGVASVAARARSTA